MSAAATQEQFGLQDSYAHGERPFEESSDEDDDEIRATGLAQPGVLAEEDFEDPRPETRVEQISPPQPHQQLASRPSSDLRGQGSQPAVPPMAPDAAAPPLAAASTPAGALPPLHAASGSQPAPPPRPNGQPPPLTADYVAPAKPAPYSAQVDTIAHRPYTGGSDPNPPIQAPPTPQKVGQPPASSASEGLMKTFETVRLTLRSTLINHIGCFAALAISIVIAVVGFARMTDDTVRLVAALVFLVSESWTVSNKIRDHKIATVAFSDRSGEDPISFVHPRIEDFVQIGASLLAAAVFAGWAIAWVDVSTEWNVFSALMMVWVANNAIVCCKDLRDRLESTVWDQTIPDRMKGELRRILTMCDPTIEYKISVFVTFGLSILTLVSWIWGGFTEEELTFERKSLLTIAVLYNVASNFALSKFIYDVQRGTQSPMTPPTKAGLVGNWGLAMLVPTLCIFMMIEDVDGRNDAEDSSFWLFSCLLATSNSTLYVAKVMYDREQLAVLDDSFQHLNSDHSTPHHQMATTMDPAMGNSGAAGQRTNTRVHPQWGVGGGQVIGQSEPTTELR
mmetsp:Transcript_40741/g.93771  ORF Transcript_40741/g.93771 Transcript_40741/m.93771 type:complete len:564 (-) Transcript_40741:179-1870(-)